ncbi:hypothetical protein Cme02nite_61890 [Catellatospora methionotrophica]|uniref:Uncharacterized protein n=1 Tax=Catellatospora methionotrophica TaxID=121620 RepID=A0A8J3LEK9_9ACTN|nr:hypothetical protein Cme02nite_61890 [Catellatospora methionotrophica]
MRTLLRVGWSRALSGPAALVARLLGVPRPRVRWKAYDRPYFGSAVATLTHHGRAATVTIEGTADGKGLSPALRYDLTP